MDSDLERIGKAFEMSPHATVICNSKGTIVYANRAAGRFYPSAIKRGDRTHWTDVITVHDIETGEVLAASRYPMSLAIAGKVTKELKVEVRDRTKGQSSKVSIDAHPIKDDNGNVIGGISIHRLIE
jgi:PAS domain-containing protein